MEGLSLDVSCLVDIRDHVNKELALRFSTDIESDDTFFTDLNGFQVCQQAGEGWSCPRGWCPSTEPPDPIPWQIQPRRYQQKLPLQANFYPMPTMAYIQDMQSRLTLHTAQALGVSSLGSGEAGLWGCWGRAGQPAGAEPACGLFAGQLEVILDRRLMQDDNRGLGQGLKDNKRTCNRFRLLLERRSSANKVHGRAWGSGSEPMVVWSARTPACAWLQVPCWHCRGWGCDQGVGMCVGVAVPLRGHAVVTLLITVFSSCHLVALHPCTLSPVQSSGFFSKLASMLKALGFPGARTGSPEVTAGPAPPWLPVSCSSC